jgi:hypothetical protein
MGCQTNAQPPRPVRRALPVRFVLWGVLAALPMWAPDPVHQGVGIFSGLVVAVRHINDNRGLTNSDPCKIGRLDQMHCDRDNDAG